MYNVNIPCGRAEYPEKTPTMFQKALTDSVCINIIGNETKTDRSRRKKNNRLRHCNLYFHYIWAYDFKREMFLPLFYKQSFFVL